MAGVSVSVVNLMIAMMKDPLPYWAMYCSRYGTDDPFSSSLSASSAVSSWIQNNDDDYLVANHSDDDTDDSMATANNVRYRLLKGHESFVMDMKYQEEEQQPLQVEDIGSSCQPYTSIDYAIFVYFIMGILVLVLCLIGFVHVQSLMRKQQNQEYYDVQKDNDCDKPDECDIVHVSNLLTRPTNTALAAYEVVVTPTCDDDDDKIRNQQHYTASEQLQRNLLRSQEYESIDTNDDIDVRRIIAPDPLIDVESDDANDIIHSSSSASFRSVLGYIYGPTFSILITFCITLGLFPSWTSEIRSIYQCTSLNGTGNSSIVSRYANDLYVPWTFVLFNLGDLLGRMLSTTSWFTLQPSSSSSNLSMKLIFYSLARLIFFPLLLICPTTTSTERTYGFGFTVHSDLYSFVVQFLFAMSNGFLIASSFAHAPNLLQQPSISKYSSDNEIRGQERMSEILSLAVNIGLFSGSIVSVLVMKLTNH
jgi:Nucleoside transporter